MVMKPNSGCVDKNLGQARAWSYLKMKAEDCKLKSARRRLQGKGCKLMANICVAASETFQNVTEDVTNTVHNVPSQNSAQAHSHDCTTFTPKLLFCMVKESFV